jgi:uncharacterized protein (TIGR03790 family)
LHGCEFGRSGHATPRANTVLLYGAAVFGESGIVKMLCRRLGVLAWFCSLASTVWAGGSGLNVVVVVNQSSSNSIQLGNYYCEQRQVPPQNFLRIHWTGGNTTWAVSDFTNTLLNPLLAMLSSNQLTNQIDYVVLSMDIPYEVTSPDSAAVNSTTSTLFYGFKADPDQPCSIAPGSTSLYAGSECIFRDTPPISANSNSFLAIMITDTNLAEAELPIIQGVASDGTFPTQTVVLAKTDDTARNVRFILFDNAIFDTRLRGNYSMLRTNSDQTYGQTNLLGFQTGLYAFPVSAGMFVPGAMADNLDSFGGDLFNSGGETPLLGLMEAGASGSYGTVYEPCNYLQKFPTPQDYFYQARGFSLAESYYESVTNPYEGLLVGEPLAAPFAQPAAGAWSNLTANALLTGTTNLSVQFTASDAQRPVQQVDLFVDGTFAETLTNLAPGPGNNLYVAINGFTTNYAVPAGASILSVASNLTAMLNGAAYSNATKVSAIAHGDRIELQSMDITKPGSQVPISTSNSIGGGTALTTHIAASRTNFLDTLAFGLQSYTVENSPQVGDFLQLTITKTNNAVVTLAVTNTVSGGTVSDLTQALVNMVNTNAALAGADGLTAEDFIGYDPGFAAAQFNLVANTSGWKAAQIQANLSGSATFSIQPTGIQALDANLPDLQPRNHLYITAGVTNLPVKVAFNTTTQANGWHQLTAVAYEGSHVRTEKLITQTVQIQNGALSAVFAILVGASNTLVGTTLEFSVAANTNNVALIQLFGTGGLLAAVTNQTSAIFQIAGTNLDVGLHPFYAIVTAATGQQYRTQTQWIRLIDTPDLPFSVSVAANPTTLSWLATAGRAYSILTATNLTAAFQPSALVTPTNSPARWTDTNAPAPLRFYRVEAASQ